MLPALGLLTSPLGKWVYGAAGVALAVGIAFGLGYYRGGVAADRDHQADRAAVLERQVVIVQAAHAKGEAIAADLARTKERLNATKTEYLAYAHGISGNCPTDLGVLVGAASGANALPETPGQPVEPPAADAAPGIAAQLIGANVAENYGRFAACLAQLDALIDWHEKGVK